MQDKPGETQPTLPHAPAPGAEREASASILKLAPYAILAITAIIYSRAVFNGFTAMDDDTFIYNNPLVKAPGWEGIVNLFTTAKDGKYQPLILLTWLLEYRLYGFDVVMFHLFNVALHLLNTWLVFKVTKQLSGKTITASVVSILFALHPMHVEEVAWVAELKDTLPAFFYLLALACYLQYIGSGFKWRYYIAVLLFSLAVLLSKSAYITLPAILVLIDVYKGRPLDKRAWLEKTPLIVFSLLFLALGYISKSTTGEFGIIPAAGSFINRIFFFTYVPSFYIVKLIAPFHLAAMHYYPYVKNGYLPWMYYASLPFFLLVVWFVTRRYPFRKEVVFGALFFVITISFMEQIISIGPSITPERYTYLSYIGFFYIAGQGLSVVWESKWKIAAALVCSSFMILFCCLTWERISVWKNNYTIFGDVIDKNAGNPECYYPFYILAMINHAHDNLNDALTDYNEAIYINPNFARAYDNRGGLYFQINDLKSAMVDFNTAIRLDPGKASAYNNRASLKANMKDFRGAIIDYNTFLKMNPGNIRAYSDRGMARLNIHDTTGACADWERSFEMGNKESAILLQRYCH